MWVATYGSPGLPSAVARHTFAVVADSEEMPPMLAAARDGDVLRALASMLFSTSSAIAFSGLLCESAMMRNGVPVVADLEPTASLGA